MKVLNVLNRIYVVPTDLEKMIQFYESIFVEPCALRFTYAELGLELARVGPFLLISGTEDKLDHVQSTQVAIRVDSLNDFQNALCLQGAVILEGPNKVPTGWNMIVKHPDGTIAEYVQHQI